MRGKMMLGAVLLLLLAGGIGAVWKINRVPVPVSCYIYDQCGGCSVTDHPCNACTGERQYRIKMESMLEEAGVRDRAELKIYNVLYSFYRNDLTKAMQTSSEPAQMTYPAVFVGSTMLLGKMKWRQSFYPPSRQRERFGKSWVIFWGYKRRPIWEAGRFRVLCSLLWRDVQTARRQKNGWMAEMRSWIINCMKNLIFTL
ncbi:MAG: hypothetical protein ACLRMZ_06710 [Blautia marasmi]